MKIRSAFKFLFWSLLAAVLAMVLIVAGGAWYFHPQFEKVEDVIYGRRHETDLTFDIFRPADRNGLGVLVILSGGWRSDPDEFRPLIVAPLLRSGYTVFAVSHLSQPKATVMEIVEDIGRAARFIRGRAVEYGVDPDRLGASGASAGGHLSLMLATRGLTLRAAETGAAGGNQTRAIRAVAVFCPVTDLLNLGDSTENAGDGGPPKSYVKAFGPDSTNLAKWKVIGREFSPIYHVDAALPPILILHGDKDDLVPLDQSRRFQARAREEGCEVEIVVRRGKAHAWLGMIWDMRRFARWFDRHLRPA